jgi:hypothetical protein
VRGFKGVESVWTGSTFDIDGSIVTPLPLPLPSPLPLPLPLPLDIPD